MATPTTYTFTINPANLTQLAGIVQTSSITTALDNMSSVATTVSFNFKDVLSTSDQATLTSLVSGYVYAAQVNITQPVAITDGNGNIANQLDVDNAQIIRLKAAKKGWTYCACAFEITTSAPNSVVALNFDGTSKTWITMKCFDALGAVVTDSSMAGSVVKTQVDFEPPYDYEIIGGEMRNLQTLSTDMRLFIVAAPDVPYSYGGSRVMAENLNLLFLYPGNMFAVDGRASKLLTYNPTYHSSKLRFIIWHAAGISERLMIDVEHYKQ